MEINAFVRLRGTFSVGSADQVNLPPAVRAMLQRALQRSSALPGLPSGGLVIGHPGELSGENMSPSTEESNRAEHPLAGAFFSEAPAIGVLSGGDAAAGLSAVGGMAGATPAMEERVRRLSGAIAGSIFSDLVTGAIRLGEPGPPPASESAIAKLERGVTPELGATCTICLCGLHEAPSEGDGPVPTLLRMPCGHDFHEPCLLHWVREHNTCPVCRYALEQDPQPRMPPLISMLHGWREAAEAASAPAAALGDGTDGPHGFGRTFELPLGVELSGGHMRLFHTAPPGAPSDAGAASSLSAAFERIASRHRLRTLGTPAQDSVSRPEPDGPTLSPTSRISMAELRRRLEAIGVQPPLLAPKAELVRLLKLHERIHRAARRADGPDPHLRLQLQMQMVQMPTAQPSPPRAAPAEASGAVSPRRSERLHGRTVEEAEEEAEADDAHCAKRQRVRH
jgi:hypothetical protein